MDNLKKNLFKVLAGLNLLVVVSFFLRWVNIIATPSFINSSIKKVAEDITILGSYSPLGIVRKMSEIRDYMSSYNEQLIEFDRVPKGIPAETNVGFWLVVALVLAIITITILIAASLVKKEGKVQLIITKLAIIIPFVSALYYTGLFTSLTIFILRNNKLSDNITVIKPEFVFILMTIVVLFALVLSTMMVLRSEILRLTENQTKWSLVGLNGLYIGSFFVKWIHLQELPFFVIRTAGDIDKTVTVLGNYSLMSLGTKLGEVKQYYIDNGIDVIYQVDSRYWFILFLAVSVISLLVLLFVDKKVSLPLSVISTTNATLLTLGFVLFTHKYNAGRGDIGVATLSPIVIMLLFISIVALLGTAITLAERNRNNYGYIFIAPFVITFVTFTIYSIGQTFYFTFTNKTNAIAPFEVIGFDNWARFVQDAQFRQAFVNTWQIWGLNIVLQLGMALLLVFIFSDITWKIKWLGFFRTMFYLPNLITLASVAMLFRILLDWKYGPINQSLVSLGIMKNEINWFASPALTQMWVAIIGAWLWFGNSFLFLMAGVQGISGEYFEAAKVDGANRIQMFTKITLPLLRPIMVFVSITSLIGGMQIFELPQLLTDGLGAPGNSLMTMVLLLYNQYFKYKNMAYASTVAYGLFFVTIAFTVLYYRLAYANKDKGGVN